MCGWRAAQDHDVFFSHFTIMGKIKGALSKQRPPRCASYYAIGSKREVKKRSNFGS